MIKSAQFICASEERHTSCKNNTSSLIATKLGECFKFLREKWRKKKKTYNDRTCMILYSEVVIYKQIEGKQPVNMKESKRVFANCIFSTKSDKCQFIFSIQAHYLPTKNSTNILLTDELMSSSLLSSHHFSRL